MEEEWVPDEDRRICEETRPSQVKPILRRLG